MSIRSGLFSLSNRPSRSEHILPWRPYPGGRTKPTRRDGPEGSPVSPPSGETGFRLVPRRSGSGLRENLCLRGLELLFGDRAVATEPGQLLELIRR